MAAGELNAYHCSICHQYTVTVDLDDGVTPFLLGCRATDGCTGMAESMFYPPQPWPDTDADEIPIPPQPTFEWYAPDAKERKRLRKRARQRHEHGPWDHVSRGGLLLRAVQR